MWKLWLLLSVVTNALLLAMSRIGYVDNMIYMFAALNSMLFLLCYFNYRRSVRHRHVLSFQNMSQNDSGKGTSSKSSYKPKQAIKQLHQQFEYALHVLKNSELVSSKTGHKALYDKPWLLLLGAKGAGKSALIQQSGLDLIHIANHESEEELPANLSALFQFSADAVFIEADGEYVTEGRAHDEWLSLLKLLRHHRHHAPINGLVLTLDITDFLLLEEPQRNFRLMLFRERINEMIDYLGIIFPVYIVFTQCDKVSGFNAYFADLSESEKNQIWGANLFELHDKGWRSLSHLLKQRLTLLTKQLQLQLVDKLANNQDVNDKTGIVAFTQQFTILLDTVSDFTGQLLKASAYKEQPLIAGIYFTSAGESQPAFGGRGVDEYAQSVFIQALFKELVIPLQGMAKANRSTMRFNISLKATVMTSTMIGVVAGISFMLSAYLSLQADFTKNKLVIDDLVKSISTEASDNSTLTQSLTLLRQRFLALTDDANEFEYFLPYLALDEKRLMVKDEMEKLYFHVLNLRIEQELQPLLKSRMSVLEREWAKEALTGSRRSEYYNLLKLSLMLSCEVKRLDIPFATQQLVQLWLHHGVQDTQDDERLAFTELVMTYLHEFNSPHEVAVSLQPWKSLKPTIKLARMNLAKPFSKGELYQMVIDDAPLQAALTINTVIPARFQSYVESNTAVPWIYSQAGWNTYVQNKLALLQQAQLQGGKDWVLAQRVSEAQLQVNLNTLETKIMAVRTRYFDDYAGYWSSFVESIRYSKLNNIQQTQATLNALASPNGLFTELISNMVKNIYLFDNNRIATQPAEPIAALIKHFPILNQLNDFQQQARHNEMFTQFQRNMLRVNKDLFSIISSYSINDAALAYTGDILSSHQSSEQANAGTPNLYKAWNDTQVLLARFNEQSSVQLTYLLTEPMRQSWLHLFAQSRIALESKWQEQVYRYFQRGIAGHYPFSINGPDTSLSQLSTFFNRHDGLLWQFVARDLNAFIADFRLQKNSTHG
ncbi:type VI secretion protein IcmF/TssM N-terminal domain-containing protein [Moritella sp. F3]|uniref:type VI secretion protein IcmF/TssM N-terminal domain-containing protein n=1 Tax=Moritella sp. F3 TaxID=2718882 RepID=UPI0018E1131D|nr:type VI secretion protein IcmF/TssM N-terminal domain-containing protein [Moritella sp. F3]GIC76484.1 hypothetical protein FMO001_12110 [Moritella sp. F1]GIC80847.1 hypothetical protein FMO003_11280 [Moritella sp. F3]